MGEKQKLPKNWPDMAYRPKATVQSKEEKPKKIKPTWEWRGKIYTTEKSLLAAAKAKAREDLGGGNGLGTILVTGPHLRHSREFVVKIQVAIGKREPKRSSSSQL